MIAASDNAGIKETQLPRFLSFLFPPRDVISWSLLSSGLACLLALPNARSCSLSHSSCVIECFFSIALAFTFALCDSLLSGVCTFPFPISLHLVLFFPPMSFPSLFAFSRNLRRCLVLLRSPAASTCSTFPLSSTVMLSAVSNRRGPWTGTAGSRILSRDGISSVRNVSCQEMIAVSGTN